MAGNAQRGGKPSRARRDLNREVERWALAGRLGIGPKESEEWSMTTLRALDRLVKRVEAVEAELRRRDHG